MQRWYADVNQSRWDTRIYTAMNKRKIPGLGSALTGKIINLQYRTIVLVGGILACELSTVQ